MTVKESINIMCKKCTNYEMCQGTGCEPKRTLTKMYEHYLEVTSKEKSDDQTISI